MTVGLIKKREIKESGEVFLKKEEVGGMPPIGISESFVGEDVVSMARDEARQIREEAQARGIEEGRRQAHLEVEEKIKAAFETLNQAVKARKKIIKDAEAEILRLALKAAEQIIRSEVSLHRDVCLNIVSEAISRVSDREQVIVRVNRDDAEYIKRYKDRLSGIVDGIRSFSVLEDNQIEPGGCVIETNLGYIDSRISTKLAAIEEAFKKISGSETEAQA